MSGTLLLVGTRDANQNRSKLWKKGKKKTKVRKGGRKRVKREEEKEKKKGGGRGGLFVWHGSS